MRRRRRVIENLPTPAQRRERRLFIAKGIAGTVLLVAGTGSWLASRTARRAVDAGGPLDVFTPEEAGVLLAVADRMLPDRPGFPRPRDVQLAVRMDRIAAMADEATQRDLRQLVRLFDSSLSGLLLDGRGAIFTESDPERQDARLATWAHSRVALRRTGYRALKRLCYAAYYGSPETWAAVGYPGPPIVAPGEPVRRREPLRRPEPTGPEQPAGGEGAGPGPSAAGPDGGGAPGEAPRGTTAPDGLGAAPSPEGGSADQGTPPPQTPAGEEGRGLAHNTPGPAAPRPAAPASPSAATPAPGAPPAAAPSAAAPPAAPTGPSSTAAAPPAGGEPAGSRRSGVRKPEVEPSPAPSAEAPPRPAPSSPPSGGTPAARPPRRPSVLKPFTDRPIERDPLLGPKGGGDE